MTMRMSQEQMGQEIARVLYGYRFPDTFRELTVALPFDVNKPDWSLHDLNERRCLHEKWEAFSQMCGEWYQAARRVLSGASPIVPDYFWNPLPVEKWHVFPPRSILGEGIQLSSIQEDTTDSIEFATDGPGRRISNIRQDHRVRGLYREVSSYFFEDAQPQRFMMMGAASVFWQQAPQGFDWKDHSVGNAKKLAQHLYDRIASDFLLNAFREVPYAERNDHDLYGKPDKAFSLIPEEADGFLPPIRVSFHECYVTHDPLHFPWIVEITVYGTQNIAESAVMASLWQARYPNPSASKSLLESSGART